MPLMTPRLVKHYGRTVRRCTCCRAPIRPGERYIAWKQTAIVFGRRMLVTLGMQHEDVCPRSQHGQQ